MYANKETNWKVFNATTWAVAVSPSCPAPSLPQGVKESVGELQVPEVSASALGEHGSAVQQQHVQRGYGAVYPGEGSPAAHRLVPVHHGVCVLAGRSPRRARRVRSLLQGQSVRRRLLAVRRGARLSAVPAQLSLRRRRWGDQLTTCYCHWLQTGHKR